MYDNIFDVPLPSFVIQGWNRGLEYRCGAGRFILPRSKITSDPSRGREREKTKTKKKERVMNLQKGKLDSLFLFFIHRFTHGIFFLSLYYFQVQGLVVSGVD